MLGCCIFTDLWSWGMSTSSMSSPKWLKLEQERLRHDNMYRLLAVWEPVGDVERQRFYALALQNSKHKNRAPHKTDAMVCVSTILLALHTGDHALMAEMDKCLLASKREREAFGCFLTLCLPPLIDALRKARSRIIVRTGSNWRFFCAATAWMCQV